jgi:tetratricopeptide (TPR) repeat protein
MDKKLLSEANKAYRKKKYKKALDKYLAFSQHYPDDIKAQERIAICYYEIGQLESAQQICELVINAKTETIEFYRILSLIFEKQGKPEDAEKILRSSIETFPNSASLHNTLGTIFMNQKKLDESIECYQNAIELDNNFWQAYFNLASVFRAKQQ